LVRGGDFAGGDGDGDGGDSGGGSGGGSGSPAKAADNPVDELWMSEQVYLDVLVQVKEEFFPKLRSIVNAQEAMVLLGNWAELIPLSKALVTDLRTRPVGGMPHHPRCHPRCHLPDWHR
jgi:hypothetical protein